MAAACDGGSTRSRILQIPDRVSRAGQSSSELGVPSQGELQTRSAPRATVVQVENAVAFRPRLTRPDAERDERQALRKSHVTASNGEHALGTHRFPFDGPQFREASTAPLVLPRTRATALHLRRDPEIDIREDCGEEAQ